MNHALATSPLPPPSLTVRGDEQLNATWNAVTIARHDGVDDVHRRIDHALSLRGRKRKVEETWSAIMNSASEATLTEEVIRPMFMHPPETANKDKEKEGSSEALRAKRPRSQRRRRRRKPESKRTIHSSPFYPFKILRSSRRNTTRRNRQEEDSRKRRRENVKDSGIDSKRQRESRPSRPKDEDPRGEKHATVNQPYDFWRPQENFFSVQIPTVRQHSNANQRRDEKRRQRGRHRDHNKSGNPRELEQFWSEHLMDLSRDRSKKGKRRKHHGAPYRRDEIGQKHLIHHHSVGDGKGHTNIVIRV